MHFYKHRAFFCNSIHISLLFAIYLMLDLCKKYCFKQANLLKALHYTFKGLKDLKDFNSSPKSTKTKYDLIICVAYKKACISYKVKAYKVTPIKVKAN